TGDGLIGHLAGARYRSGREGREEYGEPWAPVQADEVTLGSTILFYTKDAGRPVRFVPPRFAVDIQQTAIPERRVITSGVDGCHYWWIEWGGEPDIDPVHDNERVRDELWAVIYGIWDYIKNSGKFEADTLTLEWVGALPGKREYRRLLGDHVLTQHDVIEQRLFADRVAYGGWSIDLHPPEGVYSARNSSLHWYADGQYHIPFRSLYSVNVGNLLMAGRNVSASHVAFGTIRVMATCAAMGEAAGTAAALCARRGVTPRELHRTRLAALQQTLLRQDAAVLGLVNDDPDDLARRARVRASSALSSIQVESAAHRHQLVADVGITFPVDPSLSAVDLLIDADEPTTLTAELTNTGQPQNFVPGARRDAAEVSMPAGARQWVRLPLAWQPEEARTAFLIVRANPALAIHVACAPLTGVLAYERGPKPIVDPALPPEAQPEQPVSEWRTRPFARMSPCLRVAPETKAFAPEQVINGYVRPWNGPHLWCSAPMAAGREEWLELSWDDPVSVARVHLTFNDDPNEYLNNLHYLRVPFAVMPELVRDYRLEARTREGAWRVVWRERGNRKRRRVHTLADPIATDCLRLVIEATNGAPRAEVIELRAYGSDPAPSNAHATNEERQTAQPAAGQE
ncbi:MAG: FAD-dependent oxidoreductase, partial [Thermomicrobiales bacterium]